VERSGEFVTVEKSFLDVVETAAVQQPDSADRFLCLTGRVRWNETAVEPVEEQGIADPHDSRDHVDPSCNEVENLQ
jgi:hypothetical protein